MKRVLKFVVYLVLFVVAVAAMALGYIYYASGQRVARTYAVTPPPLEIPLGDAAAIERGRHLVRKVSLCVECHGEDLGGKSAIDSAVMAKLWGSNLTSGRGGVGRSYTDADFVRVMTHGVKQDGRSVIFMPSQDYKFTAYDMGALVAYIRTLPPVDRDVPAPVLGPMARILGLAGKFPLLSAEFIDHDTVGFVPVADRTDAAKAGDYLISTAGCRGCHGPHLTGEGGMPNAGNLTPIGIGAWSDADFRTAIREARRPNGTTILPEMPRIYKELSNDDLSKIFAYLKTLPPTGTKSKNQAL
jgi:cytochrome c553